MKEPLMPQPLVQLHAVTKIYTEAEHQRCVLRGVNATFYEGEFAVILGRSGSGKSTLLNVIAGIDSHDEGQIYIGPTLVSALNERERTLFRRDHLGIIFQFFNLIPTLTVLENILLPYELRGAARQDGLKKARALLARVGLPDREKTFPDRLSGGEQQRVAIARALVHDPLLILADEPTGNLDGDTGEAVMKLLLDLTRDTGRTLLMVTHNTELAGRADRTFRMVDGVLSEEKVIQMNGCLPEAVAL
jgi:putative ABC transport system ATP-binding protein